MAKHALGPSERGGKQLQGGKAATKQSTGHSRIGKKRTEGKKHK